MAYTTMNFSPLMDCEMVSFTVGEVGVCHWSMLGTGCFRKVDGMWFEIGRLHYHLLRWFGRNVMLARYE